MFLFTRWKLKQHKPRLTETSVNIDPVILGYIQCVDAKTNYHQGRIVTWDLPGNKMAVRSAKKFFVPGSA